MLQKIKKAACFLFGTICTLLLFTITVFALMQVCGRYIFRHTFFWVEDISALILGWMVAFGVPWVWLLEDHIAVDMIDALLPETVRAVWNEVIQFIAIVVGAVLVYSGFGGIRQNRGFSISMLRYDESIKFYFVVVLGVLLIFAACLTLLLHLQKHLANRKNADPERGKPV